MLSRRKPPPRSPAEILSVRPVRRIHVDMTPLPDGGGRLRVPVAQPTTLRWLFRLPPGTTKAFEFDAVGVFVWDAIDGHTTVEQIIQQLAAKYRLNLREAQVPTLQFLQTLMKKGLVGVPRDDQAEETDAARNS